LDQRAYDGVRYGCFDGQNFGLKTARFFGKRGDKTPEKMPKNSLKTANTRLKISVLG
jgi:hypothetical protein